MGMQTGANDGRVWLLRYPDCITSTHISEFEKVKFWGAMRYGKLSTGIIMQQNKGSGKLNARDYCSEIMDGELFNFWMSSMEDVGGVLVMEDGAPYHKGAALVRREQGY
jgi:hypothetical protein